MSENRREMHYETLLDVNKLQVYFPIKRGLMKKTV